MSLEPQQKYMQLIGSMSPAYPSFGFGFWESLLGTRGWEPSAPVYFQESTPITDEEGWYDWLLWSPPYKKLLIVWRPEWEKPSILCREDLDPMTNISGLKWKLTGIAKETV